MKKFFSNKKSHTIEEGGAHLKISFWHLLNLKSKYLLKNYWSGSIKNKMILIFTMLHFKKMYQEKHQEISLTVYQKSWWYINYSSCDIEHNRQKLVTLGHFLPFYPPKNPKNQNFEKWKNSWRYHYFTNVYQKSQSLMYG